MSDAKNPQSRKWLLTCNNPDEHGFTHDKIISQLGKMKSLTYWCLSYETGVEGTYHVHIFIYSPSPIKASTIANRFNGIHRDIVNGTCVQNREYVFKEGKWLNTEKGTTNHRETHEEWGDIPIERPGARNDLVDLYDMIKDGMSNYQILESCPKYINNIDKLDRVRQTILEEKYKNEWRNLEVVYVWGVTGSGKTRGIMDKYGYSNVYRVTDYAHPFDAYNSEDVIVFEEFRSCLYIDDMLKYLDGYPVKFPARYANKQACFTKVFIVTNIDLRRQYPNVQKDEPMTWQAFLRRIHRVKVYNDGEILELDTKAYLSDFFPFFGDSPFKGNDEKDKKDGKWVQMKIDKEDKFE